MYQGHSGPLATTRRNAADIRVRGKADDTGASPYASASADQALSPREEHDQDGSKRRKKYNSRINESSGNLMSILRNACLIKPYNYVFRMYNYWITCIRGVVNIKEDTWRG